MTPRPDYAREIRAALTDPRRVLERLGVDLRGSISQGGGGVLIRCPSHEERSPSCSVTRGDDGTIRVKCFGCDWSGDALTLVATVRALPLRSGFREVLTEAAEIAGLHQVADELRSGQPAADRPALPPAPPPPPPREYPDASEVRELWSGAAPVTDDRDACRYLVGRRLDPELVHGRGLARSLRAPLPPWAVYGRRTWLETGHTLLFRVCDARGAFRSVRVSQTGDAGDMPKRLPPKGKRAAELVLANRAAWAMLRGDTPGRVLVAEGETDWLTLATVHDEGIAVLGIGSGSWTDDFAAALPRGADVVVYTDPDDAGERYAQKVFESIGEKCRTWRAQGTT